MKVIELVEAKATLADYARDVETFPVIVTVDGKPIAALIAVRNADLETVKLSTNREFLEIDVDNFDDRLKSMKPRVAFQVPNTLTGEGNMSVDITFDSMDDFSPAAVARKVDALNKLLTARTELSNLLTYMDGKSGAEELIAKVLNDPTLLKALSAAPNPEQGPSDTEEQADG